MEQKPRGKESGESEEIILRVFALKAWGKNVNGVNPWGKTPITFSSESVPCRDVACNVSTWNGFDLSPFALPNGFCYGLPPLITFRAAYKKTLPALIALSALFQRILH